MKSLYEARAEIRKLGQGVWASPACERIVQEIMSALNEACTEAEKLGGTEISNDDPEYKKFFEVISNMRLKVWSLFGMLKQKVGSVLQPRNMPVELDDRELYEQA